ncbi:hypothetical protein B4N84_17690 [Flavobacterium sp. IR1]|nr:hypothetical protein B4N84_17690 [Flavobacterium sp. IR1]
MKNLKIKNLLHFIAVILLALGLFTSCDSNDSTPAGGGPLTITRVALAEAGDLVPVETGDPKNYYIISGSGFSTVQKIYFNDFDTYFNPVLVTDTEIFVLIDEKTPYANASNQLKIVTKTGSIVYDFVVKPPTPRLGSYNPINAAEGEEVTIYGDYFLNPILKVGDVEVPVVSSTLTEIKFLMPADAKDKYVTVTNISGSTVSSVAIGSALYDDTSYYGLSFPDWNNHTYPKDGTAAQGLIYIKSKMTAFGSLQGEWSWFDELEPYAGIRVTIKAEKEGQIKFCFNGDWGDATAPLLKVTTEWKTFLIPWSALSSSDRVQNITFQNMTKNAGGDGIENTFSIDDIGLYLK